MRTRFLIGMFLAAFVAAWSPLAFSQAAASAESHSTATAANQAELNRPAGESAATAVKSGTKINAALESSLDARTAKPGERVEARVLKNVKQNGRIVVHKGDHLVGHVTQVQAAASGKGGSEIAVAFDRLAGKSGEAQLNTVLTSVFSANSMQEDNAALNTDPMMEPMPAPSGGMARGGGGLLGGAASTVGSAAGATAGAIGSAAGGVGGTVDRAGGTLGAAAGANAGAGSSLGLTTPVRAIHIQSQAQAENQTSMNSVLSTRHGDLRLQSGTRMQFRVAGESEAKHHSH